MNGYFNGTSKSSPVMAKGGGLKNTKAGSSTAFKEKAGFNPDLPGKSQPKARDGGVKHVKRTEGLRKGL